MYDYFGRGESHTYEYYSSKSLILTVLQYQSVYFRLIKKESCSVLFVMQPEICTK